MFGVTSHAVTHTLLISERMSCWPEFRMGSEVRSGSANASAFPSGPASPPPPAAGTWRGVGTARTLPARGEEGPHPSRAARLAAAPDPAHGSGAEPRV